jgi:hypothetical protein
VVAERPGSADFEGWLLDRCTGPSDPHGAGAARAMALEILHERRLARTVAGFRAWLAAGALSDDRP